MKKLITSAGLVALGAASLHAQSAAGLSSPGQEKPWHISAALRGFYDDNYTTRPKAQKLESFGVSVRPSAGVNWRPLDQTRIGLAYVYDMRYYEDREPDKLDHSHEINGTLTHSFSERYVLDVSDSFVVAQEPEVLDLAGPRTSLSRSEGDNIRNMASGSLTVEMTEKFSSVFGYQNTFFNYEEEEGDTRRDGSTVNDGSRSALLDRVEHLISAHLRWTMTPSTVGVFGYQYGIVDYTSKDALDRAAGVFPDNRDNDSHYAFVGADQKFSDKLNASLRVGAQYRSFDNPPPGSEQDMVSPYIDGNLMWTYVPGSYFSLGGRHSRTQTDVSRLSTGGYNLDAETTAAFATWNHVIIPEYLTSTVMGTYQHSLFDTGGGAEPTEDMFIVGASLTYNINRYLAAEAGYNYDRLDSDIGGRSFTRNRVFIGIRAIY